MIFVMFFSLLNWDQGLREVLFSGKQSPRIDFPGRPIFIQLPPEQLLGNRGHLKEGGQKTTFMIDLTQCLVFWVLLLDLEIWVACLASFVLVTNAGQIGTINTRIITKPVTSPSTLNYYSASIAIVIQTFRERQRKILAQSQLIFTFAWIIGPFHVDAAITPT